MRAGEYAQVVSLADAKRRRREDVAAGRVAKPTDAELAECHRAEAMVERVFGRSNSYPPVDLRRVDRLTILCAELQAEVEEIRQFTDPSSLAGSVLGLIGNSGEEIRRQINPFREALKDNDPRGGAA